MRPVFAAVIGAALLWCTPVDAGQRRSPETGRIGWIGLYRAELVEWLENENGLDTLCASNTRDSDAWQACRDQMLQPKVFVVRLRTAPSKQGPVAGDLIVEATPGKGLRAFYVPAAGGAATPLSPDILDSDWGYGPFFHHSIVERRGTWVRLPEVPLPRGTWLDIADLGTDDALKWLEAGDIVESPQGDLYVLEVADGRVRARPEQPRDMWCEAGPQPPVASFRDFWLDRADVYSPTGHIRLKLKYTRGC